MRSDAEMGRVTAILVAEILATLLRDIGKRNVTRVIFHPNRTSVVEILEICRGERSIIRVKIVWEKGYSENVTDLAYDKHKEYENFSETELIENFTMLLRLRELS